MAPDDPLTILHHGTTLRRARAIETNGPDPDYREPGSGSLPAAEAFSAVIGDGRPCGTGTSEMAARNKHALFPNEGGPAILEVSVPASIMAILYPDPIAAGLARGGEIRFEPECGLSEFRAEWHKTSDTIVATNNQITELLGAPLAANGNVEELAEKVLGAIAVHRSEDAQEYVVDADRTTDRQTRPLLRPLLACLATKSAAEAGTPANLYFGQISFKRAGLNGPVWILGQFENQPGTVRVTLRRSSSPLEGSEGVRIVDEINLNSPPAVLPTQG